jgi:predicted enzyme related to lactoylglutathione lyase
MIEERDGYPAGVPCWIDLEQDDPAAAADFYGRLFGWDLEDEMPPGAPGHYFSATLRGKEVAGIGSRPEGTASWPSWRTYIWVDDADATAARAVELGGAVAMAPMDIFDAGRMAVIADPEGARFGIWQAGRHRGAVLVNEPATWNFSTLHARDLDGALAFYGGLFGWEGDAPDPEAGGTVLLRRPGYGDHLEELDPGLRAGMAEMGAPAGFEDAVAWLAPLGDEADPYWDVAFGVADADATAARAAELGAEVLVPPTDMPWVRMTVLRDPQGAVLTASQFVPPDQG